MSGAKAVGSKGVSTSWNAGQSNVVRILNEFKNQDDALKKLYGEEYLKKTNWLDLPQELLASCPVYERFAYFLLHEYKITGGGKDGKFLDGGSPVNYLATAINLAADKHKVNGSADTKLFFSCLDSSSTGQFAKWLRGVKKNTERQIFVRTVEGGEELDNSERAPPHPTHPCCSTNQPPASPHSLFFPQTWQIRCARRSWPT